MTTETPEGFPFDDHDGGPCEACVRYESNGTFVPKNAKAEEIFAILGLPNPCPADQFEAALREDV